MIHKTVMPSEDLFPYLSLYHVIENGGRGETSYQFKAGPKTALALCWKGEYHQEYEGKVYRIPEIAVIGPVTVPYSVIFASGPFGLILAEFTETSYFSLFRRSPGSLFNSFADFRTLGGETAKEAENLLMALTECPANAERIGCLEDYLRVRSSAYMPGGTETVRLAAEAVKRDIADVDIAVIAEGLGTSVRTLQRSFKLVTGLTPKQYAEIVRFTKFFDYLMSEDRSNLLEILHALGYYDQAHAIRKFKTYAGYSPTRIIREKFRLAAGLSSPFSDTIREPE